MIAYGMSLAGTSHVARGVGCQDSFCVMPAQEVGTWVAAIADGVGSRSMAEAGSRIAAREAAQFCARCLPPDRSLSSTFSMVRTAMNYAWKQIEAQARADQLDVCEYDTTLTLAIFDGARVVYGHAGDGALIALRRDGAIEEVTRPQRAGEAVIPLRGGYRCWQIGLYPHNVASLLLVTDGMRDALVPHLLQRASEDGAGGAGGAASASVVYEPLARFFADPMGLTGEGDAAGHAGETGKRTVVCERGRATGPGADAKSDEATGADDAALAEFPRMNEQLSPDQDVAAEVLQAIEDFVAQASEASAQGFYARLGQVYAARHDNAATALDAVRAYGAPLRLMAPVSDDKTVIVLANPHAAIARSPAAPEPDWQALIGAWSQAMYPDARDARTTDAAAKAEEKPREVTGAGAHKARKPSAASPSMINRLGCAFPRDLGKKKRPKHKAPKRR